MNHYNKIPKALIKDYNKRIRGLFIPSVIAFIVFPVTYLIRKKLFAMGTVEQNLTRSKWSLYWFYDSTEFKKDANGKPTKELDFIACTYGDDKNRIHWLMKLGWIGQYFASMIWLVFRNSLWNRKQRYGYPLRGKFIRSTLNELFFEPDPDKENDKSMTFRNEHIKGVSAVLFDRRLNNTGEIKTLFRYSHTIPLGKFSPWRLLGYKWVNKVRGYGSTRPIYKNRKFR